MKYPGEHLEDKPLRLGLVRHSRDRLQAVLRCCHRFESRQVFPDPAPLPSRTRSSWRRTPDPFFNVPTSRTEPGRSGLAGADQRVLLIFGLVAAGIALAGYAYLRRQQADMRKEIVQSLETVADLKVDQIASWRHERLSDARFLMRAPAVAKDVAAFLTAPEAPGPQADTRRWLELLKGGDRYERMVLFDRDLTPRIVVAESKVDDVSADPALVSKARQTGDVCMGDLTRDAGAGRVHMDVVAPVFPPGSTPAAEGTPGGSRAVAEPIAFIELRLDPRRFLFPLIQNWPTPSASAETLLVRRDGGEVVYLNELRHRPGGGLVLRRLVSEAAPPAARAIPGGQGALENIDYRGVPVLAVARQIPETPWVMVAKVDQEEVYAPLRRQAWRVGGVVGSLVADRSPRSRTRFAAEGGDVAPTGTGGGTRAAHPGTALRSPDEARQRYHHPDGYRRADPRRQ